jgi:rubrerythrin
MRNFFELDQYQKVTISPDIYSIPIFKRIWDRDKTKGKTKAYKDLGYIFWMCDFRSYVADITDQEKRHNEVVSLLEDKSFKPDKEVEKAIEIYKEDLPISLLFLEDVKVSVNELRKYFRELDLTAIDDKGKLIHDANKVMTNITKTGELLDTLEKHEQKIKRDMDTSNSVQGGKIKSMYED